MSELRPGTNITPTIRLLRPLGEGGMGRVWVAEHLSLHTNVVVKLMAKEIAANADAAARFSREASVAAAVKSPHVTQVFDHGVMDDGTPYIVMELLEGQDLAQHLSKTGRLSPPDTAALVAQVAKALGKAHQVGVVHRDIKPDNIFLCEADSGEVFVKLLDFGIAKQEHRVEGSATTTGMVVGTPYYMSPEQILGEKDIDARTDIWSLGVVAFEALTGRRPFAGTTVGAITLAIHTAAPKMTPLVAELPPALDEWFAKACARAPADRFQTAREASQALSAAVGDLSAAAPLLRAPMLSMVDSDPSLSAIAASVEPTSEGRSPTNLSSAFPVPVPKRGPSPLVIGGAVALVALVSLIAVLAITRSGTPAAAAVTATAPPSATPSEAASVAPAPSAIPAVSSEAPAESAAPTASAAPSSPPSSTARPVAAPAGSASPRPTTRPTSSGPKPAIRTPRRDDDDIK